MCGDPLGWKPSFPSPLLQLSLTFLFKNQIKNVDMWLSMWEYVAVNVGTPGNLKKQLDPLELELQVIGSHSWFALETQMASSARQVRNSYPPEPFLWPAPSRVRE